MPSRISCATTERARGVSRDGLRIVWHLRRGVRWSDGASFDARDVAFTIRTNVDPRNNEIGGSEGWNLIARVETPDPYTVGLPATYIAQLASLPAVRSDTQPNLRTTHLDFLMTRDALADRAVRKAMRLAIDRRTLVLKAEHGRGLITDGIVWPLAPVLRDDSAAIAQNVALAKRTLSSDGWRPGPDGVRVKAGNRLALALIYQAGAPDLDRLVELIRAELRDAGIELATRTYTHSLLFSPQAEGGMLASGKFDLVLYPSTIVSLPDLASNFDCAMAPPSGENYLRLCDPRIPALLRAMRESYDPAAVRDAFKKLDSIFIDEVPSIQLFVWKGSYATNHRVIKLAAGFPPALLLTHRDISFSIAT